MPDFITLAPENSIAVLDNCFIIGLVDRVMELPNQKHQEALGNIEMVVIRW